MVTTISALPKDVILFSCQWLLFGYDFADDLKKKKGNFIEKSWFLLGKKAKVLSSSSAWQ